LGVRDRVSVVASARWTRGEYSEPHPAGPALHAVGNGQRHSCVGLSARSAASHAVESLDGGFTAARGSCTVLRTPIPAAR